MTKTRKSKGITAHHVAALEYVSRRGGRVPEDDLTPLTIEYLADCEDHGLCERVSQQLSWYWALTGKGVEVAYTGSL